MGLRVRQRQRRAPGAAIHQPALSSFCQIDQFVSTRGHEVCAVDLLGQGRHDKITAGHPHARSIEALAGATAHQRRQITALQHAGHTDPRGNVGE